MLQKPYYYNGKPTKYMVFENGQIHNSIAMRFISPYKNRGGYLNVDLYIDGVKVRKGVHQIVAETFVPNPDNKPMVNHIDGNKENNHYSNLEWVTCSENNLHAYSTGLRKPLESSRVSFVVYNETQVTEVCEALCEGYSPLEVEEMTGVPVKTIYEIRNKQIWKGISTRYDFPKYKYPRSKNYDPKLRETIEDMILENPSITPREIMRILNLPFDNAYLYKAIQDWKYMLMKAQRPSRNGVEI